jgi:hypothetical protein
MTVKEFSTDIAPAVQAITSVLGLLSLVLVWWQIRKTNAWNRVSATFALMELERFESLEKAAIEACRKIKIKIPSELTNAHAKKIRSDAAAYHAVKPFIMFIDKICVSVQAGFSDKDLVSFTYGPIIRGYYTVFRMYIAAARADGDAPEAFRDFEQTAIALNTEYKSYRAKLKAREQHVQRSLTTPKKL